MARAASVKKYLTDALWGIDLPSDPSGALRSNLYGLRKAIPIKGRLQTGRDGYGLALREGDVLDLHLFQSLAQQARAAGLSGDVDDAARLFQCALDTWGDPPLADIPATPIMQPVISELLEHRHAVQESLVDARLALGQHHELHLACQGIERVVVESTPRTTGGRSTTCWRPAGSRCGWSTLGT